MDAKAISKLKTVTSSSTLESVARLLEFEDLGVLNQFRFSTDGIHMWPLVRYKVLSHCLYHMEGFRYEELTGRAGGNVHTKTNASQTLSVKQSKKRPAPSEAQIIDNIRALQPSDVLIFSHFANNRCINGVCINKFSWPFESLLNRITLVEDSETGECSKANGQVLWHENVFNFGRIHGAMESISEADRNLVDGLIVHLGTVFKDFIQQSFLSSISNELRVIAVRLRYWKQIYQMLFNQVKPKLLVLDNASYGNRAFLVYWAKQQGIRVAEHQHGEIHQGTPAYRNNITSSSHWLQCYMPDDFLLWGKYWCDKYQGGAKKYLVGNPYFQESQRQFVASPQYVLVGINGYDFEHCFAVLKKLAEQQPGERFRIRFHSLVREMALQRFTLLPDNCELSEPNTDFYDDLAGAKIILSETSTAVVEAIQMGVPCYVFQSTSWSGYYQLPWAEDLIGLETLPDNRQFISQPAYYFGEDWRKQFADYLTNGVSGDLVQT